MADDVDVEPGVGSGGNVGYAEADDDPGENDETDVDLPDGFAAGEGAGAGPAAGAGEPAVGRRRVLRRGSSFVPFVTT